MYVGWRRRRWSNHFWTSCRCRPPYRWELSRSLHRWEWWMMIDRRCLWCKARSTISIIRKLSDTGLTFILFHFQNGRRDGLWIPRFHIPPCHSPVHVSGWGFHQPQRNRYECSILIHMYVPQAPSPQSHSFVICLGGKSIYGEKFGKHISWILFCFLSNEEPFAGSSCTRAQTQLIDFVFSTNRGWRLQLAARRKGNLNEMWYFLVYIKALRICLAFVNLCLSLFPSPHRESSRWRTLGKFSRMAAPS